MAEIIIKNESGVEVKSKLKVTLGRKFNWTVSGVNGTARDARWTISGFKQVIADYVQDEDEAKITEFALTVGNSITGYWAKTGVVEVMVKARVAGHSYTLTVNVTVVGPTLIEYSAETDQVKVAECLNPDTSMKGMYLTFGGDLLTQKPGIRWTAKVIAPPRRGYFAFTQLMTISRKRRTTTGILEIKTSNDEYVLDEVVHYEMEEGQEEKEEARCLEYENLKLESEDSPSSQLYRKIDKRVEEYDQVEVAESFRTYLMYKPDGGVWVAVALLEWSWDGKAVYDAVQTKWVLDSSHYSIAPAGKKVNEFPVWKKNRYDFM